LIFSARQHIAVARYYTIARPSVLYPSVTRVNHTKTVEDRVMKFFTILVFTGKFHPEILTGSPERELRTREGWENQLFCSFKR